MGATFIANFYDFLLVCGRIFYQSFINFRMIVVVRTEHNIYKALMLFKAWNIVL